MNEQRARENSAYVRKLLSEREPEFAAALAAAERYISWSFRPGGDEDRDDPLCSDSGTVMLLPMAMLRESKRPVLHTRAAGSLRSCLPGLPVQ
jgi:hypothetical protein